MAHIHHFPIQHIYTIEC